MILVCEGVKIVDEEVRNTEEFLGECCEEVRSKEELLGGIFGDGGTLRRVEEDDDVFSLELAAAIEADNADVVEVEVKITEGGAERVAGGGGDACKVLLATQQAKGRRNTENQSINPRNSVIFGVQQSFSLIIT